MRILSIDVGYKNLALCLLEDGRVVEWEVIDAIKEDKGATPVPKRGNDPIIIGLVTKSLWSRQEKLLTADCIVIEKQPPRARVMRVLEGAIQAFFHTCRLAVPTCKVAKIDSFSARDKFKEYEHRLELKGKKKYAARKKASVELCTEYLRDSGQESELFQKAKKRDDLADALMQGIMRLHPVSDQQMDAAAIAVARAANLATYGDKYKKEAQGLGLIARALQEDGRLVCHKSFEKALADFCVHPKSMPGALALGVQLKTTGVNMVQSRNTNEYYQFGETSGYTGLLIVLVALHVQPPRIWLADGSRVVSKNVQIPTEFRRGMRTDRVREVSLATVADAIYAIYNAAMSGISNYVLRSPQDHEKPTDRTALAEYNAFKRLQRSLSVLFVDPPAEHMSYDYVVNDKKWQLKLARYNDKRDMYTVTCQKAAGRVDGKPTYRQYKVDDFDFLCIQLPLNTVDCCYVIPQGVLKERGLIGVTTKACGNVCLYPHRRVAAWKSNHTAGVHWAEAYRIDFANDPLAQLARITGSH